jgi:hypothetical protein
MLPYLNAEANFIRAFGNRCLLLIFLCALTRTANPGKLSALGISLDISPGVIVVFGPLLALLLLISLKIEADGLFLARESVLEEASKIGRQAARVSWWVYPLFATPLLSCLFMTLQFLTKLVPLKPGCEGWSWVQQLTDFSFQAGSSSIYCIRDLTDGTPWIYPPAQTYLYILCFAACAYLTWRIMESWPRSRAMPG